MNHAKVMVESHINIHIKQRSCDHDPVTGYIEAVKVGKEKGKPVVYRWIFEGVEKQAHIA